MPYLNTNGKVRFLSNGNMSGFQLEEKEEEEIEHQHRNSVFKFSFDEGVRRNHFFRNAGNEKL